MAPTLPAKLPMVRIASGTVLYRAHTPPWSPLYFGPDPAQPPTHRFHAPDGSYRACFIGRSEEAAFAEGVVHGPVPTQLISRKTLEARAIAMIHVLDRLVLVPLYGPYLMRLGATASVTHGADYAVPQSWGKAIHDHAQAVDGILYTSRHDETTFSIALFERAAHKIEAGTSSPLAANDLRTLRLLARYGLGLV